MFWCLRNFKLHNNVEKATVFQRPNNLVLSLQIQRQNFIWKQHWIYFRLNLCDTKSSFIVMLWWLRNHKLHVNIEKKTVYVNVEKENITLQTLR